MRISLIAAVLTLATTTVSGAPELPTAWLTGEAFRTDGRLAYREFHEFVHDPAVRQVTTYRDDEGREFGRMDADYATYRYSPAYRMVDTRHQTIEAVTRDGSLVHVERTVKGVTTKKTLQHSGQRELVVGPGFNEFVKAHWDALLSGEAIVCDFVIPNRLQIVAFRITHVAGASIATNHRFSVKADNFFLRLLAPELTVEYDRVTRGIQSYEGPSNVNDIADNTQHVTIRFPAPVAAAAPTTTGGFR